MMSGMRACSAFILVCFAATVLRGQEISTKELESYLEKKDSIFFLDVREPEEIQKLGSVEGYVNIPLGQVEKRMNEIPKDKLIITL